MFRDPVRDTEGQSEQAPERSEHEDQMREVWFAAAADIAAPTFGPDPDHYMRWTGETVDAGQTVTDPVCGMEVDPQSAVARRRHQGHLFYFCSKRCAKAFDAAHDMVERLVGAWNSTTVSDVEPDKHAR